MSGKTVTKSGLFLLSLLLLLFLAGIVLGAVVQYGLPLQWTTAGGGGVSGGDYAAHTGIGQSYEAVPMSGGSYGVRTGFWSAAEAPEEVYLPVILSR